MLAPHSWVVVHYQGQVVQSEAAYKRSWIKRTLKYFNLCFQCIVSTCFPRQTCEWLCISSEPFKGGDCELEHGWYRQRRRRRHSEYLNSFSEKHSLKFDTFEYCAYICTRDPNKVSKWYASSASTSFLCSKRRARSLRASSELPRCCCPVVPVHSLI